MSLTTTPLVFCSPDTGADGGSAPETSVSEREKPAVLLLHGMCRSRRAMAPLARHFEKAGYTVLRPTYPSRKMALGGLTNDWLIPYLEENKEQLGDNWCVVSHSRMMIPPREWLTTHQLSPSCSLLSSKYGISQSLVKPPSAIFRDG